jgi:hypothetical protein
MRKYALALLKFAVTVAVLGWLLSKFELGTVLVTMRKLPLTTLAIGLCLVIAQPLIAAVRWHFILRHLGAPISFARTLQLYWVGLFAAAFLPGGIAGDGVRVWMLVEAGVRPSRSINSVLLDRAGALIGLLLLVAASLPFVDSRVAPTPVRYGLAALLVVGLAAGVAVCLRIRIPARWHGFRAARALSNLLNDLRSLCLSPRWAFGLICLSFIAMVCGSLNIFLFMRYLGAAIDFVDAMALGSFVILALTLPVSFGGWGLREGSMVGLFGIVGVAPAISLSVSIMIGLFSTAVSLPGALAWLQWRHTPDALAVPKSR